VSSHRGILFGTGMSIPMGAIACAVLAMTAGGKDDPNSTGNDAMLEPIGHQIVLEIERAISARTSDGSWFTSAAWSPDGAEIAAAGGYPETDVFRASSLSVARKLDGGPKGYAAGSQHSVAFSADGRLLVSGALIATVWDTGSWRHAAAIWHSIPGIQPGSHVADCRLSDRWSSGCTRRRLPNRGWHGCVDLSLAAQYRYTVDSHAVGRQCCAQ
jgi:hypothetical protein